MDIQTAQMGITLTPVRVRQIEKNMATQHINTLIKNSGSTGSVLRKQDMIKAP